MAENVYPLTLDEAKVAARALIHMNNYLVGEFEKIHQSENVSDFLVEAARAQYNELVADVSKLHVALGQTFPELTVR